MSDPYSDLPFTPDEAPETPPWAGEAMPSLPDSLDYPAAPALEREPLPTPGAPAEPVLLDVEKMAFDLAAVIDTTVTHEQILNQVVDSLEKLTKKPPHSKPSPWLWAAASGAARQKLWNEVSEFVDVYNSRFGVYSDLTIQPCWYQHPVVIEEITALMLSWRASHYGHQVPTIDPNYWLQNFLYPALKRIRTESWGQKSCTDTFHEDVGRAAAPPRRDLVAFAAHVETDLTLHPATTEEPAQ